jgi:ABC-type multidrug transport system ATPase subunit
VTDVAGSTTTTVGGHSLTHRYGRRTVLDHIDFAFAGPGIVAIRGANGAGKSTLLRLVLGLMRPTGGQTSLAVGGRAIPPRDRRRVVGYSGPELAFYPELTGLENLTFAADARGLSEPRARALEVLATVGLAERADELIGALSSGMLQRLRLAFGLLGDPAVLLLDEPGTHLDDDGRRRLECLVKQEGSRRLVVIATNDEREGALAGQRLQLRSRGLGHSA